MKRCATQSSFVEWSNILVERPWAGAAFPELQTDSLTILAQPCRLAAAHSPPPHIANCVALVPSVDEWSLP